MTVRSCGLLTICATAHPSGRCAALSICPLVTSRPTVRPCRGRTIRVLSHWLTSIISGRTMQSQTPDCSGAAMVRRQWRSPTGQTGWCSLRMVQERVLRQDCRILRGKSDKAQTLCLILLIALVHFKVQPKTHQQKMREQVDIDPLIQDMQHSMLLALIPSTARQQQYNPPQSSLSP